MTSLLVKEGTRTLFLSFSDSELLWSRARMLEKGRVRCGKFSKVGPVLWMTELRIGGLGSTNDRSRLGSDVERGSTARVEANESVLMASGLLLQMLHLEPFTLCIPLHSHGAAVRDVDGTIDCFSKFVLFSSFLSWSSFSRQSIIYAGIVDGL